MIFRLLLLSAFAFVINLSFSSQSLAGGATCIAGLPCVTNFTPNDPMDVNDGPNASGAPNESKSERDSCDADFMNQIYARSFLEANRELMIGWRFIAKPDSVLEYSCFRDAAQAVADTASRIFSSSGRWRGATISNPGNSNITYTSYIGPNVSIGTLVLQSLNSYTSTNFPHTFLGGTPGGPSKSCNAMNAVWTAAKCDDINDANHFMSFEEIVSTDPRNIPSNAGTCSDNPITTDLIAVANNDGGTYAAKDDTVTYIQYVGGNTCAPPIFTGVMVRQDLITVLGSGLVNSSGSSPEFPDAVCSTPGCYYDGSTCVP